MIHEYYNNTKASYALKLPQTDIQVDIKEAIDWFKEQKMI